MISHAWNLPSAAVPLLTPPVILPSMLGTLVAAAGFPLRAFLGLAPADATTTGLVIFKKPAQQYSYGGTITIQKV